MNQNRAWSIGFVIWGAIVACTPSIRELGDEPPAGSGGSGGGKGGSGSVLPKAGSSSTTPGDGGAPDNVAGAPNDPEPCFSPSQSPELALEDGALGCVCNATDPVCISDLTADPPWYGMLECEDGRWKSVPPSCDRDCFSPKNSPQIAIVDPTAGCSCNDDPPECVETVFEGRPWRVSLYCEEGKWTSAEDGVCGDGRQPDCRVDGVTYPHGARRVPNPLSVCNTCECSEGELVNCTTSDCADTTCDEGSFPAIRCAECGPADECLEVETGCLSGEGCEDGICVSPWCV